MSPPAVGSPGTFPLVGHFSDEDIHELLGAMGDATAATSTTEEASASDAPPAAPKSDDDVIDAEARAQARSERKRSREKQRRSDVNKQFADLSALLKRIESEDLDGTTKLSNIPGPTNRVDLIARTIAVLERMHDLHKKQKNDMVNLNQELEDMKKVAEDTAARLKEATVYQQGPAKPVMMMVPMMVNPEGGATLPMAASPFMQPQMMMPAAAAAMTAPGVSTPMMHPATQPQPHGTAQPQPHGVAQPQQSLSQQQVTQPPQQQQVTQPQVSQSQTQVSHPGHPLMSTMMQHPGMTFAPMMFSNSAATTVPATAPPATSSSPTLGGAQKQPPTTSNMQGGNLAHCA